MLPDSVGNLYKRLRSAIMQFRSPAFRRYFLRKAEEDLNGIELEPRGEEQGCGVRKYLEEQGELLEVLKRQTVIYNMFYDDRSQI